MGKPSLNLDTWTAESQAELQSLKSYPMPGGIGVRWRAFDALV